MAHVTVVVGPPGAGKTTYVNQHAQPGDLVVDLDTLLKAMTVNRERMSDDNGALLPFVCEVRDAIVHKLAKPNRLRAAWIISTNATAEYRLNMWRWFKAEIIVLPVPADECMRRIRADDDRGDRDRWQRLVDRWWAEFRPTFVDKVIEVSDAGQTGGQDTRPVGSAGQRTQEGDADSGRDAAQESAWHGAGQDGQVA